MSREYQQALRELSLRLETLKIHGHGGVATDGEDWRLYLRNKLKELKASVAKKKPATAGAHAPAGGGETLEDIRAEVEKCRKCALAKTRTNTVFGVGNPKAELMFIGEGPGAEEDAQGEPFVGRAGKLLNDMIGAMGLSRGQVYIANIVKCRPPGNRDPLPEEAEKCMPYLTRQLKAIKPEYICALGAVPSKNLLNSEDTIGKLRGRFHDYQGINLLATYHPSYLLRNPSAKGESWKDLKLLMDKMGLEDPRGKK
ncbi:MAG: uracil-DNA glycosylase [Nitrospinota bacterium]|nr:uracil-DNA glycosylase [Nitrospinota bacterium]